MSKITAIILANLVVLMFEMCAWHDYRVYGAAMVIQLLATNWLRLHKQNTDFDRFSVRVVFLASICATFSYTYMLALFGLHLIVSLLLIPTEDEVSYAQ